MNKKQRLERFRGFTLNDFLHEFKGIKRNGGIDAWNIQWPPGCSGMTPKKL